MVQYESFRCSLFYHIVRTKRQILCNCFSVFPGRYRCYQCIFCIDQLSVSVFIFLIIRCIDIFSCIDIKFRTLQVSFFINKILFESGQHFTFFIDRQLSFYRMVLVIYRNNGISALRIHLVCCVCIHRNLYIVLIDCVPFRCVDFLNPVMSDLQILRHDQISLAVRKIGLMGCCHWVSCYLFHILFVVQVIYLKFCSGNQYGFLCFIVFFHDFQFCLKLFIQKHSPDLWLIWMMLCDIHFKIIDWLVVVRCCCLTHDIASKW